MTGNLSPERRGIPTMYRGVKMRSRLEARWAAMFDEIGWPWAYEPIDLDGYIPDYLVSFEAGKLLTEVKGAVEDFAIAESKIECSGWTDEALVVGATIDGPVIGRILEWDGADPRWGEAQIFFCISCGMVSVLCVDGSWRCRACGADDGNSHVGEFALEATWANCGNRVQWRPE